MNVLLDQVPGWIEQAQPQRRKLQVSVLSVPPSNVEQRYEYEGLFASTFDAYDDALDRFPHAARIEVKLKGGCRG